MIDPSLPLIDLHRHLDGSVRLATILELGKKHQLPLPALDLEELRPHVQVTTPQPGILAFFTKFKWQTGILVDYSACQRVAWENVEDAFNEGIDYIELRFSPWFMAEPYHLDVSGVVEAVLNGIREASKKFPVKVNVIGILSRTYGPEIAWKELSALLAHSNGITGIDLAGDELHFPGELFVDHFRKARDSGMHITIHAGEAAGPESIWQAIHDLGAERIGHAVRAVEDPVLMDYLRDHRIAIESSLTSNFQTSTVPDYKSHPIRQFLEHGIPATINTDDPGISAIDLKYEYDVAAPSAGLSASQIHVAQQNALEAAFLSEAEKQALKFKKTHG